MITNAGLLQWSGGDLFCHGAYGAGFIVNRAGALLDAQADNTISAAGWGTEAVHNAGTFRKSAGSGVTTVGVPLTNTTGIVEAHTGTISLGGGGSFEGTFHAAAGTVIRLAGGAFSYSTLPSFTGPGTIELAGATLTLLHNLVPGLQMISGIVVLSPAFQGGTITNLALPSGIDLSGNYTVSGVLNGAGGIAGDLTIASGATVNWSGTLSGNLAIASGGTLNWSGGSISGNQTVAGGGTLNWTGGGTLLGALNIASSGVLNFSGGNKTIFGVITNAGLLQWSGGDLFCHGAYGAGFIVNRAGALLDAQADNTISAAGWGTEAVHNAGTFRKSAGSGVTTVGVPLTNTTGIVEAHTGTIAFQSAFHQTPDATLAISIGGPTPGADYGRIQFAEPLALAGSFTATARNGYLPNPGDTFNALSYPSFTGEFTCLTGINLGGGIALFPAILPKAMTLTAVISTTNGTPTIFATRWLGGVRLYRPPGFTDWEFVVTTNLFAPVWTPVPATGCDQVTLPVTAPEQYFRLRRSN